MTKKSPFVVGEYVLFCPPPGYEGRFGDADPKPGQVYRISAISGKCYISLDGFKHIGGGIHDSCFKAVSSQTENGTEKGKGVTTD